MIFADGTYEGKPFVKPLKAQSHLLLRSGAIQKPTAGTTLPSASIPSCEIEQMGIELVAKTVQPWISKTADRNFIETLSFVSNFSRTAEKNPQGMQRLATRLATIDEPTRNELVALCFRTAERYAAATSPTSPPLLAQRTNAQRQTLAGSNLSRRHRTRAERVLAVQIAIVCVGFDVPGLSTSVSTSKSSTSKSPNIDPRQHSCRKPATADTKPTAHPK